MRQLVGVLAGSLVLALGPTDAPARAQAPAAVELRAFSDSAIRPAPDGPPPSAMTRGAHQYCPPPAAGAKPADLEQVEKIIASLEARLGALPPNDPQRPALENSLKLQRARRDQLRAALASPPPPPAPAAAAPKPLTFAEALANTRQALEQRAGRPALAALAASPEGKAPARASLAAAAAVAAGNPGAALAALLAAHQVAPKDPAHLSNAAAVLNALGRPAEALAFLDQAATLGDYAGPIGMRGRALVLNNRGHALLGLKRFADAEKVLAQAVALEPLLVEARANLAVAQLCGGKSKEAARSFAASVWRTPARQLVCLDSPGAAGTDPKVCAGRARKAAAGAFDLSAGAGSADGRDPSAGKPGILPPLPYPEKLEGAKRLVPFYLSLERQNAERTAAYHRVKRELNTKIWERERRANATKPARNPSRLTQQRFYDLKYAEITAVQEPSARPLAERISALSGPMNASTPVKMLAEYRGSCAEKLQAYRETHRKWLPLMREMDEAARAVFAEVYRIKTGLVANASDPLHHQYLSNEVDHYAWSSYYNLSARAASWIKWVAGYAPECLEPDPSAASVEPGEVATAKVPPCPPFVRGAKLSINLGEFLVVQVNCEQVEVEASNGKWFGPFGNVGYKFAPPGTPSHWGREFDGQLTVALGVKARLGPEGVNLGLKTGAFVTVDGNLDLTDGGFTSDVSAGVGNPLGIEIAGGNVTLGIASSSATWLP